MQVVRYYLDRGSSPGLARVRLRYQAGSETREAWFELPLEAAKAIIKGNKQCARLTIFERIKRFWRRKV